jgi:hypothetical protein
MADKYIEMIILTALAQGMGAPPDVGLSTSSLPQIILTIVNYALALVAVIALGFIVYGGFLYITAHGESQQVEKAKGIIVYAVIGIIVIGVAAAVVTFIIGSVTGG